MPTSWYQAIPNILTKVKELDPASILDIGVGFGKYGMLFRDLLEIPFERYEKKDWLVNIDGIEVFEAYHNPIYDFAYDRIQYGNILELLDTLPDYDCITLIDVLEHFTKEEGFVLIERLVQHCKKGLLVSTPFYPETQPEYLGNRYEKHKSIWSLVDFDHFNYVYERVKVEHNGAHLFLFKPTVKERKFPYEMLIPDKNTKKKKLSIAYLLPHKNLTGGMKMLLQQMKYLKRSGHFVTAMMKDSDDSHSALPEWFDLEIDREICVPKNKRFLDYTEGCDILVAGWISQLVELEESRVPVVYWEQGNEWLFGDIPNPKHADIIAKILERCYLTRHAILSVSPYVANNIYARFGRKTPVLTNGIDTEFYKMGELNDPKKILLIGNPHLMFKGFDAALRALTLAWSAGYRFEVEWVCQTSPSLPPVPFPIRITPKPSQENLVKSYQSAGILLFTSWYEGFGMPPLEAMSCGAAVICTKCGGIDSFGIEGHNMLTAEVGNISGLAANVIYLLKYPELREALARNGRETALSLDYSKTILYLEEYLYAIIEEEEAKTPF